MGGKGRAELGRRRTFLKNAAVLTVATLLLRLIGMAFRIVISNQLGAEGMGLYQIVLSVYMLASTLASAGLSIAVTRLVSEEQIKTSRAGLKKLMTFCIVVSVVLGVIVGVVLYFTAGALARYWIGEEGSAVSLQVLSLSLPFMAVSATLRGYFTARRKIGFTSVSQLLEQGVKFAACMGLIAVWGIRSTTFGCFLVMAADTLSEWFSFAFQYVGYKVDTRKLSEQGRELPATPSLGARLAEIVLPIAGVRIISSTLYTVENTLVPSLLEKFLGGTAANPLSGLGDGVLARLLGLGSAAVQQAASSAAAHSQALAQWGQLKGMGIPVLMFPSTLLASFVLLLVPELSEYKARNDRPQAIRLIGLSLHVTLASAIGVAAGLYLLAQEICEVFYPGQGIGFYVQVLAPLVPFMYLENVAEGMLKGLGEQKITLNYSLINVAVRIVLIVLLVPQWGMQGFLWMMLVDNVVTSLLHAGRVLSVMAMRLEWGRWVVRPLVSAAVVLGLGALLRRSLVNLGWSNLPLMLAVGGAMAVAYMILLLLLRSFTREELLEIIGRRKKAKKAEEEPKAFSTKA